MGAILQLIIGWVLVSTHITQLHGSPMRGGRRVYGREFLRIPVPENKTEIGSDTIDNIHSRTRQDSSRIDQEIADSARSYIVSQRVPNTHIPTEERKSSVTRSSSFSRSIRLPWYKDSPLPVSNHTSQEAVRRRLHIKNQTFDIIINKRYLTQNHSSDFDSLRGNSQNNSNSSRIFSWQNNNYYPTDLSLNSSILNNRSARIIQQNIPPNLSITRSESVSSVRHGSNPFRRKSENHKFHIDSTTSRTPIRRNQTVYTKRRKLVRDTTTFSPLTTETISQTEPTSTTEFFLYQLSEYDDYYYPIDEETQVISTADETPVTNPYISQETLTKNITEASSSNHRDKNIPEYQLYSKENSNIPLSVTLSTTEKSIQLYNKTIKLIPRKIYNHISPISTTVQISSTSATPIVSLVQTRRPNRPYKYTTPSILLRQRLLANRFKIRRNPSSKISQSDKSNSQRSTNSVKNNSKELLNISYSDTNNNTDPSYINITNRLGINNRLSYDSPKATSKLLEPSTSQFNVDYSIDHQTSLSGWQLENPSKVNIPLETSFPLPSPLHLLADPLVVELSREPITKNQGFSSKTLRKVVISEKLTKANQEIEEIQEELSVVTNDDFSLFIPSTETPITVLPILELFNITEFIPYNNNSIPQTFDNTIPPIYISTDTLDINTHTPVTYNYSFSNLTASSTAPSTTLPSTTLPSTTLPSTTLPSTTLPSTTLPSTTLPSTTLPSRTLPSTTLPSTTLPSTTLPSTTLPSTTLPSTTLPSTTLPSTTSTSTTIPSTTIKSRTIPVATQSSMKIQTKEETKASWEAQSRSLSTSAVRTEVRTTEHEVHVKIYEKLPTPPTDEITKMLESLERLKKQQGTAPFGSSPFGTNPGGTSALGTSALGSSALGTYALGTSALGTSALGTSALGISALGTSALGTSALGTSALGTSALGTSALGTSALGLVPEGQYPEGINPLGSATSHQTPRSTESTSSSPTFTTSTSPSPNILTGNVIPEPNQSKFQLERKTKDGFIIGEYGVVDHDNGNVNGVRYTAEGNVDPKLIYDALQKFLSLK